MRVHYALTASFSEFLVVYAVFADHSQLSHDAAATCVLGVLLKLSA